MTETEFSDGQEGTIPQEDLAYALEYQRGLLRMREQGFTTDGQGNDLPNTDAIRNRIEALLKHVNQEEEIEE